MNIIDWIINNRIINEYKYPPLFENSWLYHFTFMKDACLYLTLLTERIPKRIPLLQKHEGKDGSVSRKQYTVRSKTKLKENILNLNKTQSKSIPTPRGICAAHQARNSRFGLPSFYLVLPAVWRHPLAAVFSVQSPERILEPASFQESSSFRNPQPISLAWLILSLLFSKLPSPNCCPSTCHTSPSQPRR